MGKAAKGGGRKRPTLIRPMSVMMPLELLELTGKKKSVGYVYMWLWQYDGNPVTCDALAEHARMRADDVRAAIRFLVDAGYVKRHENPGFATQYELLPPRPMGDADIED